MNDGVTFQAIFNKATTTIDGGWRVSFDVPQTELKNVSLLTALREHVLQVAVVVVTDGESVRD